MSIVTSMSRVRTACLALVAVAALAAAGCGGGGSKPSAGGGSVPSSASIVPAGAPLYVYANTDFGGAQWDQINALLAKFPDKDLLTGMLRQQLSKQGIDWDKDVKPALGPESAAAVLSFATSAKAILATQPKDQAKLDALIAKLDASGSSPTKTVKRQIGDWTVIADSNASLDKAAAADKGSSLADSAAFKDAMANLPDDALVKVFVDGQALGALAKDAGAGSAGTAAGLGAIKSLKSIAASLEATKDGFELQAVTKGLTGSKTYTPELLSSVPSGALAFISFDDLGAQITMLTENPQLKPFLGQFETALGVTPAALASMLSGEGALYVRAGAPLPEVTMVLTESDAQGALATLDKIANAGAAALGSKVESTTVGGVSAKKLTVQGVAIYYAAVDGKLVITDAQSGITGLSGGGTKLADDPVFKEASDAAGLPKQTTGMFYVNVKDTVPLVDSFASLAGQALPPQATSNLEHVRSFIAYGTQSGDESTFKAFLQIK
jgi:hypothetical protein